MAHDCRRTELFQGELLAALQILQRGDLPLRDLIAPSPVKSARRIPAVVLHQIRRRFRRQRPCRSPPLHPRRARSTANLLHTSGFKMGRPNGEGTANFEPCASGTGHDYRKNDRYFCGSAGGA